MSKAAAVEGKSGLELIEQSVQALRLAPARVSIAYYIGTLPFAIAWLYFWSDMSQSAYAHARLPGAALGLTCLFIWMKTWQTRFAVCLRAFRGNEPSPPWRLQRWLHVALVQTILQPAGLFLLPLALLLLFPFGWLYAFFQNATALAGDGDDLRTIWRRSVRQSALWPGQNHVGLLILKLFGAFIFINLIAAVLAAPFLMKTLLGVENSFTRLMQDSLSLFAVVFNTTFMAAIFVLTYLCLDPLIKTFYVLRCFYGESLHTGEDLKTELRPFLGRASVPALVFFVCLCMDPAPANAAQPVAGHEPTSTTGARPSEASALDKSIDQVLKRREYSWRMPRQAPPETEQRGAIGAFFHSIGETLTNATKSIGRFVQKVVNWFGNFRRPPTTEPGPAANWISTLHNIVFVLSVLLVCLAVILILRWWHRRRRARHQEVVATPVQSVPDIRDENVGADKLPEDGWLAMAQELTGRGEFRLALRAFYLASLAHLAGRELITIAKFKSNRDYQRELERRGHALPGLYQLFQHNVSDFDRVWYGLHEVNRDLVDRFAHNVETIRSGR